MGRLAICLSIAAAFAFASVADAASIFQISGGGDGHGIGMSQYGAYGYALHGTSYRVILAHYYRGTQLARTNPYRAVRVLIATGAASFSGATQAQTGTQTGSKQLHPGDTYSVQALADGTLNLSDASAHKKVGRFGAPLTVSGRGSLDLAGRGRYRGALEFRVIGGAVQTVDAVGLDDYVRGVIAAEMPSSWSEAALEAQAVAARSYAITSDVGGDGYQLYPDTRSQMYGGVAAETPATDAAVAATRGQILTYAGAPVATFFFASSGGHTEDIQNVWLGSTPEPWLRGVSDPYDGAGDNPYHRWSYRMTIAGAAAKLGSLLKGRLIGIRVTKYGVSPRVVRAEIVGTRGRKPVSGPQLQDMFGLPSTYMTFTTISTTPAVRSTAGGAGAGSGTGRQSTGGVASLRRLVVAAADAGFAALLPPARGLAGSVFPSPPGATAQLQRKTKRGWRTLRHIRLGVGGAYRLRVADSGTYRLVYRDVAGSAVTLG